MPKYLFFALCLGIAVPAQAESRDQALAQPGWALLPKVAKAGVVVPDVGALDAAVQAFVTAGKQRTLNTLLVRAHTNLARQFGLDLLDPKGMAAAGLVPQGGLAVVYGAERNHPVAIAQVQDAAALRQFMVKKVAGPYVKAILADEPVGKATLTTLRLSAEGGPRVSWAVCGQRAYLAGPGSDGALRTLLRSADADGLAPNARLAPYVQALGQAQGYVLWAGASRAAPLYHVMGLHADATGWVLQAQATSPQWQTKLCTEPESPKAQHTAQALGHVLAPDALAMAYGPSTASLSSLLAPVRDPAQAQSGSFLGAQGAAWMRQGQVFMPPLAPTLAAMTAPWAWVGCGNGIPPTAAAHPKDLIGAAVVVRAENSADKARLRTLAQNLQHDVRLPGLPRGKRAVVTLQGTTGPSLTPNVPGSGWAVAVVHDTLIAAWGPGRLAKTLALLDTPMLATEPGSPGEKAPVRQILYGEGHLTAASNLAQDVIALGAQGPLQNTPLGAMPSLLMMGPTGDALRELGALGDLTVQLVCTPQGVMATVIDRLVAP